MLLKVISMIRFCTYDQMFELFLPSSDTTNNPKIVWTEEFLAFLRQFLHFPSLLLYSWGGFDWSPLCQRASSPISDGDIAFLVGFKKSRVLAFQALRCCCCQNECFLSSHENEKYFDLFHLILSLAASVLSGQWLGLRCCPTNHEK